MAKQNDGPVMYKTGVKGIGTITRIGADMLNEATAREMALNFCEKYDDVQVGEVIEIHIEVKEGKWKLLWCFLVMPGYLK
jgi:hypothetical protein